MPRISVLVAAYNVEGTIARCLESVRSQTMDDLEVIVVDDCSTDATPSLLRAAAASDSRVSVIRHEENRGLHLARRTGVEAATGDYALFLDGDDELLPDMLAELDACVSRTPTDIVHFGITVKAEAGLDEAARSSFEDYINRPSAPLVGDELLRAIYDEGSGQLIDWRATQRLYRTSLLKRAFDRMCATRLERAEDGYECFVIASLAREQLPLESCRGLVYHYGGGVTGTSRIDAATFDGFCRQFDACIRATEAFVADDPSPVRRSCLVGMRHKMLELLANDWHVRVPDDEKATAASSIEATWGPLVAGRELWRIVRDEAYVAIRSQGVAGEGLSLLADIARSQQLDGVDVDARSDEAARYRQMRAAAEDHLAHLEALADYRAREVDGDVRIFVTTHKRVDVPGGEIFRPVQVGPGLRDHRFPDTLHDDEGESISELNAMYCELTTQYWAWKNVRADYVGFCHYRRYFNFADELFEENDYGEVMDDFIDGDATGRYGLDDASIRRAIEGYDVVTTGFSDLRAFPEAYDTPREHWAYAPQLHDDDLERMARIVREAYPDYAVDVDEFLDGHHACFCNMYIMRQDIFHAYCSWLFPLLERFCAETDMSRYSRESLRTPGHLAERLFNIYYAHAMRTGATWRTRQLQCVHFTHPDRAYLTVDPISDHRPEIAPSDVIPVVLAANDRYVPMLATTILSMVENASTDRFYDIVVFEQDISAQHQEAMRAMLAPYPNVSLRFQDVWRHIREYELATSNEHISVETYYRFLIQEVLPGYDKVLYLDADLVILGDVAELFDTDVEGQLLAAAPDVDFVGNVNGADPDRMAYARERLGMEDPYAYFQAGVLVLNTGELRLLHSVGEWLEIATSRDFIYDDQDILNAECQGRVVRVDLSWNVMIDCFGRVGRIFSCAPAADFDAYLDARTHPAIIHYAGAEKPWTRPSCDFGGRYWEYARKTPFYEEMLAVTIESTLTTSPAVGWADEQYAREQERLASLPPKAVGEESPLRQIVDPLAPLGTRRREALKLIGRTINKARHHEV